jgi:hypothetical protein
MKNDNKKPPRKKRPDVAQRKKDNCSLSTSVVKMTWNQFVKRDCTLALPFKSVLFNMNKMAFEAYVFANLHVARLLEQNKDIPTLNQNFFYNCCSAVSVLLNQKSKELSGEFLETKKMFVSTRPRDYTPSFRDNMGNFMNCMTKQMETEVKNYLSMNFFKRLLKYLKTEYPRDNDPKFHFGLMIDICSENYEGDHPAVLKLRNMIRYHDEIDTTNLLEYNDGITKKNISEKTNRIMPLWRFLAIYFDKKSQEKSDDKKKWRSFSLLPLRNGFSLKYVIMDTSCLRDLIKLFLYKNNKGKKKDEKMIFSIDEEEDDDDSKKRNVWSYFFNIEKVETCRRKFGHCVFFDGKAVSIVMSIPKRLTDNENPKETDDLKEPDWKNIHQHEYKNFWGVDPGVRNIFSAHCSNGKHLSCTGKEFYTEASYISSNKKIDNWIKKDGLKKLFVSVPKRKVATTEQLLFYLRYCFQILEISFDFHCRNGLRDLKFK